MSKHKAAKVAKVKAPDVKVVNALIESIKPVTIRPGLIPVRYIADKGMPEVDSVIKAEWSCGVVREVVRDVACNLLYWSDTYEDARAEELRLRDPLTPIEWRPMMRHEDPDKYAPLAPLAIMDAAALRQYAVRSFNEHFPVNMPPEAMRSNIMALMNRPT